MLIISEWLKEPHIFFPIVKEKTKPDVCAFKWDFLNPFKNNFLIQ